MVKKGGYTIGDIYQGGYSSFKPMPISQSKYPIQTGKLGLTLSPQSMNQLKEISDKANSGIKQVEMEAVTPEFFDNISKQQIEEVRRSAKLTGIDMSVHGPVMDTTGVDPRRGGFSESDRELAEKKVFQTLLRSHDLNPDGNIPVTFHSAEGLPSSEFGPKPGPDGKRQHKRIIAINRETGELAPLEKDIRYSPGGDKIIEREQTPEQRLESINATKWDNSLFQVEVNRENAERILRDVHPVVISRFIAASTGQLKQEEISQEEEQEFNKVGSAYEFVKQAKLNADTLFSQAWEFAKKDNNIEAIKELEKYSKEYAKLMGANKGKEVMIQRQRNPIVHIEALRKLRDILHNAEPKTYVPIEEFALEQSSKTFGNAAFKSWQKFKDKAPILSIENPPAGFALSTGEDVRNLIDKSKEVFVEKAVSEGISKAKAKKAADQLIGATLDVGHMNMLRKYDYSEDDVVKQSEKLAPVLKHVHLSDNFGFEHTELPMGMGNVPFKKIMEKLGKKGYDAKKIIEAGQWWQQMGGAPLMATLEQIGPPMYSGKVSPYWNQNVGFQQDYFGGYGMMLPQTNYETFGAGFSQLPQELGGQRPGGGGGRMSGRPME